MKNIIARTKCLLQVKNASWKHSKLSKVIRYMLITLYTYIYIYIHTWLYTCIYIHIYIYLHTSMYTHTHIYEHIHICIYKYKPIYVNIHTYTHIYLYIYNKYIYNYMFLESTGDLVIIRGLRESIKML